MNTLVVLIPWMRKDNTVLGVDEGNEGIEGAGAAVLPGGRSGGLSKYMMGRGRGWALGQAASSGTELA